MRKLLLPILALICLSSALMAQDNESWVTMNEPEIDFGLVPQRGTFIHHFTLTSNIKSPIEIGEIKTFCECLDMEFSEKTIEPGKSISGILVFESGKLYGKEHWLASVYTTTGERIASINIKAKIFPDQVENKPVYVDPPILNTSWFGDKGPEEFRLALTNSSESTIPLKLIEFDGSYFELDFPLYIEAGDTAEITIKLNGTGIESDFRESITFEYIDPATSSKTNYSIPIKRNLFKK